MRLRGSFRKGQSYLKRNAESGSPGETPLSLRRARQINRTLTPILRGGREKLNQKTPTFDEFHAASRPLTRDERRLRWRSSSTQTVEKVGMDRGTAMPSACVHARTLSKGC